MKVFISVPMRGRTDDEIFDDIEHAKGELAVVANENDESIEYVDNFVPSPLDAEIKNDSMWYLGGAIQKMSKCDAVYFCPGWETARGCLIEHEVTINYGLECIYHD